MKKILIIPDIHGRKFWKEPCMNIDNYEKIIFLGDYLDPYPFENISVEDALINFEDICMFAKDKKDKVILLLGNHDIYYYYKFVGPSRYSWKFHYEIEKIFDEYRDLFKIAYETDKTLYTHSGFLFDWAEDCEKYYDIKIQPTAESLNNLLKDCEHRKYIKDLNKHQECLLMISRHRGGRHFTGSCIWADVHEYYDTFVERKKYNDKFQIFGHTLQLDLKDYQDEGKIEDGEPIIEIDDKCNFAMLDCRHAFEYDEEKKELKKL